MATTFTVEFFSEQIHLSMKDIEFLAPDEWKWVADQLMVESYPRKAIYEEVLKHKQQTHGNRLGDYPTYTKTLVKLSHVFGLFPVYYSGLIPE